MGLGQPAIYMSLGVIFKGLGGLKGGILFEGYFYLVGRQLMCLVVTCNGKQAFNEIDLQSGVHGMYQVFFKPPVKAGRQGYAVGEIPAVEGKEGELLVIAGALPSIVGSGKVTVLLIV